MIIDINTIAVIIMLLIVKLLIMLCVKLLMIKLLILKLIKRLTTKLLIMLIMPWPGLPRNLTIV